MDGLNVTYALGVSISFSMDIVVYVLGMCMRQISIMSVSLAGASASLVLTCSDASCGIWHPLKSPPPLLHTHKHIHN